MHIEMVGKKNISLLVPNSLDLISKDHLSILLNFHKSKIIKNHNDTHTPLQITTFDVQSY